MMTQTLEEVHQCISCWTEWMFCTIFHQFTVVELLQLKEDQYSKINSWGCAWSQIGMTGFTSLPKSHSFLQKASQSRKSQPVSVEIGQKQAQTQGKQPPRKFEIGQKQAQTQGKQPLRKIVKSLQTPQNPRNLKPLKKPVSNSVVK